MTAPAVTSATWEAEVLASPVPVAVDFWAPWCRPCRAIEPLLADLERDHAGRLRVVRVDVDDQPGLASRLGVLTLPTVVLVAGGEVRATVLGARPRKAFEEAFAPWLAEPGSA